jgi:hypothetical protein
LSPLIVPKKGSSRGTTRRLYFTNVVAGDLKSVKFPTGNVLRSWRLELCPTPEKTKTIQEVSGAGQCNKCGAGSTSILRVRSDYSITVAVEKRAGV